jgi:hypothetical protein
VNIISHADSAGDYHSVNWEREDERQREGDIER